MSNPSSKVNSKLSQSSDLSNEEQEKWLSHGVHEPKRTRLAILCQGRTGSNLLCSMLNNHPNITCKGEVLKRRVQEPLQLVNNIANLFGNSSFGFKFKPRHIKNCGWDMCKYLEALHEHDWKIIFLYRNDVFLHTLSSFLAKARHRFIAKRPFKVGRFEPIKIDIKKFDQARIEKFRIELSIQKARKTLKDLPTITLQYEKNLLYSQRWQSTMDYVCENLNIESCVPTTNLHKIVAVDWWLDVANSKQLKEYSNNLTSEQRYVTSKFRQMV